MNLTQPPIVKAQMLIRRPVREVFEAFADPAVTTQFWFTKGSGRLEPGARERWDWEMYGVGTHVVVKALEPDRRIVIEWEGQLGPETVEWTFEPRAGDTTFVTITVSGVTGPGDDVVRAALDNMGGFSLVLAGCKAWLEHGVRLNLVGDHAPPE